MGRMDPSVLLAFHGENTKEAEKVATLDGDRESEICSFVDFSYGTANNAFSRGLVCSEVGMTWPYGC